MLVSNARSFIAIALATTASFLVEAGPTLPVASHKYVALLNRTYSATDIAKFEKNVNRSQPGWNDWSCQLSPHSRPVVLVHGLGGNGFDNWVYMAPRFVAKGYCVFSLTYGRLHGIPIVAGLNRMEEGAVELSAFIDKVLAATGSDKVNLLCHLQVAAVSRYYMRFLEGAGKVGKIAAFGPVTYGATLHNLAPLLKSLGIFDYTVKYEWLLSGCYGAKLHDALTTLFSEITANFPQESPFLQKLNAGGDTLPGVQYMFMASKTDEQITPYTNCFLRDHNALVENITFQDLCPADNPGPIPQMLDPNVFHLTYAFFSNVTQKVDCSTLDN